MHPEKKGHKTSENQLNGSEEEILPIFFENIRTFNYDRAKDYADKQKEQFKSAPLIWQSILNVLSQLALAEKSYVSFLYLSPKWFGRKDAKALYEGIAQDCKKIEESGPHMELPSIIHICGQLIPYVNLKIEMIDFYSSLHAMTAIKFCDRSDLLIRVRSVLKRSSDKFFHPLLSSLKASFVSECEVLEKLLEADVAMSQWKFVNSLLCLQEAHTRISLLFNCTPTYTTKEVWKLNFLGVKASPVPSLYYWLKSYKDAIYSKFSLYFYDILCKHAPTGDMKTPLSKCSVDYYSKLVAFHKKTDAYLVALIHNSEGLDVQGPGYAHFSSQPLLLNGKQAYISIFCYPSDCLEISDDTTLMYLPDAHQTSIIMIIGSREKQLSQSDKPVDFYDEKNNSTYFISRTDSTVYLVLIYKTKKSDREKKAMMTFMQDISGQMRYTEIFQELKPN